MEKWILDGEKTLLDLGAHEVVGFRPPAGIRTPVLHRAVRKLNQPLITWNYRFYDSTIPVSRKKFSVALKKIKAGDVILLHDVRKVNNREEFKTELTFFIQGLLEKGFQFSILTRGRCSAPLA